MLTRIEIDGFKSFENFGLDLQPFTAVVGANASGKSNLFDALRFLSLLASNDIRTAMKDLRGEPEELFRKTPARDFEQMSFAVEVLLPREGMDAFGTKYNITAQRLRYELRLGIVRNADGSPRGVVVKEERCSAMRRRDDRAVFLKSIKLKYNSTVNPFIRLNGDAVEVRQDGPQKHGKPLRFSLREATKTALSTISTAEFPHLYALRDALANVRFLEINPQAARSVNDRFEDRKLKADASNLAAALAALKEDTSTKQRPDGVLSDIAADLASLIPSVHRLSVTTDTDRRQYSFNLEFAGSQTFSSRVISDGTLRLLAVLTVLNDPERRGTLCFEEPENGVHEGRVPMLVEFLRDAAAFSSSSETPSFQIIINTHSPKVMAALKDGELVVSDSVVTLDPATGFRSTRTRMRSGIKPSGDFFDHETTLTRFEIEQLLQHVSDAA